MAIKWLAPFLLLVGAILRVLVYFQNRSLFIDEANLARNYATKSLVSLWQPLDYEQYAPPLFNTIEYLLIALFGLTEYALRFFPLICGLALLVLFYRLCCRFIDLSWQWFPVGVLAFSPIFVRYATEVKQYSTDAAVAMAIILLALRTPIGSFNKNDLIKWAFIGALAVWLSMPVVFVLAGVGLYFLFQLYKNEHRLLWWMLVPIIFWIASFGVYFFSILQQDAGTDYLQGYHKNYFFPLIPTSKSDLNLFKEILLSFFRTSLGHTAIVLGWGIISFLVGVYHLYKKSIAHTILFLTPIATCLFASYLSYYSLYPRLTLFFIPVILLFIGMGTARIICAAHLYLKPVLVVLLLVVLFTKTALPYFQKPLLISEMKPVMQFITENQKEGESVFVHHKAVPAFTFYHQFYKFNNQYHITNEQFLAWQEELPSTQTGGYWFVFSFYNFEEKEATLAILKKDGNLVKTLSIQGATCYYFYRK